MNEHYDVWELSVCEIEVSLIPAWAMEFVQAENNSAERVLLVTWLPSKLITTIGLPEQCVCGLLADGKEKITPETFREHRAFVEFLQSLLVDKLAPELIEYAARCPEEMIAVIDERTSDVNGAVPSEDILGVYQLENGIVTTYTPNPNYRLVTAQGSFKLIPWLRQRLLSMVNPS